MRSRGSFVSRPWPASPLFLAIVATQVFAVLMCGFGWFVTALPWLVIGLVWVYLLIWIVVLDLVKLSIYRRIAARDHGPTSAQHVASQPCRQGRYRHAAHPLG